MFKIDHILLPTDFSPRTFDAVRYATVLARRFQSKLTLIHVLPTVNVAWEVLGGGGSYIDQITNQEQYLEEKIQSFLSAELAEFTVGRMIAEGDPAQRIVEYSRGQDVDLIIIPTRGFGLFRRFLLGSVTAKVLHDSGCAVWTGIHQESSSGQAWDVRHILCSVEASAGDETPLSWAAELAGRFGARLSVVYAMPSPAAHSEHYYFDSEMHGLLREDAKERIVKTLQTCKIAGAEVYVHSGPAARMIQTAVQQTTADLVVLARGAVRGAPGRLHPNVYEIVCNSPCPVLSV